MLSRKNWRIQEQAQIAYLKADSKILFQVSGGFGSTPAVPCTEKVANSRSTSAACV